MITHVVFEWDRVTGKWVVFRMVDTYVKAMQAATEIQRGRRSARILTKEQARAEGVFQ